MVPVGWSTWLTLAIPRQAESGGGILVAAIQVALMIGASAGGLIIDTVGINGPIVASAAILASGAIYTLFASGHAQRAKPSIIMLHLPPQEPLSTRPAAHCGIH
jgi:predicted MFS family arabinose efflux permease